MFRTRGCGWGGLLTFVEVKLLLQSCFWDQRGWEFRCIIFLQRKFFAVTLLPPQASPPPQGPLSFYYFTSPNTCSVEFTWIARAAQWVLEPLPEFVDFVVRFFVNAPWFWGGLTIVVAWRKPVSDGTYSLWSRRYRLALGVGLKLKLDEPRSSKSKGGWRSGFFYRPTRKFGKFLSTWLKFRRLKNIVFQHCDFYKIPPHSLLRPLRIYRR